MKDDARPPQKGDIVRLRQGFDRSFEAVAARRACLPLKEGAFYEVIGSEKRPASVVLTLREVRTLHIAGVRHIIDSGSEPFPYSADRFQRLCTSQSGRPVVRIAARPLFSLLMRISNAARRR